MFPGFPRLPPFRLYKKALRPEKRDIQYVRMTKGRRGRVARPTNGRYKVVDARMKKVCCYPTKL